MASGTVSRGALTLKVEGREETVRAIQKVKELVNSEAIQDVLIVPARLVRDVAKRFVRRSNIQKRPGYEHLQDAIFATKGRKPTRAIAKLAALVGYDIPLSVIVGVDRKKAPHAHLVEFGHGGPHPAEPHPFMRPAATSTRPLAVQMIEDGLRRLLAPFSR